MQDKQRFLRRERPGGAGHPAAAYFFNMFFHAAVLRAPVVESLGRDAADSCGAVVKRVSARGEQDRWLYQCLGCCREWGFTCAVSVLGLFS